MKAIVTGVTGQDGYYMVQRLLREGFEVLGLTSNLRQAQKHFGNNRNEPLCLAEFDYAPAGEFRRVVEDYAPDLIINYPAASSGVLGPMLGFGLRPQRQPTVSLRRKRRGIGPGEIQFRGEGHRPRNVRRPLRNEQTEWGVCRRYT